MARQVVTTVTERLTTLAVETHAAAAAPPVAGAAPARRCPLASPPPPVTVKPLIRHIAEPAPAAASPAAPPTVHVTIGRLEIRSHDRRTRRVPPARREPRIASLDEYLQQRAGRVAASSPLAIATVTAVMKDLLNDGLVNSDLAAVVEASP